MRKLANVSKSWLITKRFWSTIRMTWFYRLEINYSKVKTFFQRWDLIHHVKPSDHYIEIFWIKRKSRKSLKAQIPIKEKLKILIRKKILVWLTVLMILTSFRMCLIKRFSIRLSSLKRTKLKSSKQLLMERIPSSMFVNQLAKAILIFSLENPLNIYHPQDRRPFI